jgi:NADPH2:quinone reductase
VLPAARRGCGQRAHGAHDTIDHRAVDLRKTLAALTGERGIDVCVDTVGGAPFDVASRMMARNGRLVVVGFAAEAIPHLSVNLPLLKEYALVGAFWNNFVAAEPDVARANARYLADLYRSAALDPVVSECFPPSRIADALGAIGNPTVAGKLVITIADGWP